MFQTYIHRKGTIERKAFQISNKMTITPRAPAVQGIASNSYDISMGNWSTKVCSLQAPKVGGYVFVSPGGAGAIYTDKDVFENRFVRKEESGVH